MSVKVLRAKNYIQTLEARKAAIKETLKGESTVNDLV